MPSILAEMQGSGEHYTFAFLGLVSLYGRKNIVTENRTFPLVGHPGKESTIQVSLKFLKMSFWWWEPKDVFIFLRKYTLQKAWSMCPKNFLIWLSTSCREEGSKFCERSCDSAIDLSSHFSYVVWIRWEILHWVQTLCVRSYHCFQAMEI